MESLNIDFNVQEEEEISDKVVTSEKEEIKHKKTASERISELTYKHREQERKTAEYERKLLEVENKYKELELKLQKEENEKLVKSLKSAMEEGDTDRAVEIQEKMIDLRVKGQTSIPYAPSATVEEVNNYFKEKNPWYGQNVEMTIDAEAEDKKLLSNDDWKIKSYRERLDEVSRRIKEKYKNNTPSLTEGVPNYSSGNKTETFRATEEEIKQTSKMFPGKTREEVEKLAIKFKKELVKGDK